MPVYYETEIMYRWYKKPDDKTNSKKEQKVKFTSLDKEMLLSCQETIQSVTELYKWLGRKHLPPDYYVVPYDGIRDDALVATMYEELEHLFLPKARQTMSPYSRQKPNKARRVRILLRPMAGKLLREQLLIPTLIPSMSMMLTPLTAV